MDPDLREYHDHFAALRTGLAREVDQGVDLIHKILDELNTVKVSLEQTQLDLSNEREARRRLQQQAEESRELAGLQGKRPFVVALIDADADAYVFHDKFITRGVRGGEEAADELLLEVQRYVKRELGGLGDVDIMARAFANVSGLGATLERSGRLRHAEQLRTFTAGFSNRKAFLDFVDIGPGKERADMKIRESIKFFLDSFQCKHLVLACAHDAGYAPFLGQFVGDKQAAERLTLVEGFPFPTAMRDLHLKKTQFSLVFMNKATQPAVSADSAVGPLFGQGNGPSPYAVASLAHWYGGTNMGRPVAAPQFMQPQRYHISKPQSERLGPVVTNQAGRRVDKPFPVQPSEAVMEKMKNKSLCFHLFLRGECNTGEKPCRRNHAHPPLSEEEFYALWAQARKARCFKSRKGDQNVANDCSDAKCVYGHISCEKLEFRQSDEEEGDQVSHGSVGLDRPNAVED